MSKPLRRSGPRVFFCFDFNLQWLWPKLYSQYPWSLWYLHLGWLSAIFGWGKARDTYFDNIDRGLDAKDQLDTLTTRYNALMSMYNEQLAENQRPKA